MKRHPFRSFLLLLLATGFLPVQAFAMTKNDLLEAMRKLWEDHITWTRLYIVSATADLPDKDATAKLLLQNQTDIGNAVKPFYGDAAGDKLTALLRDHILIAVDIIDAAKKGDSAKKDEAVKRWTANADDIATFLSGANPKNWPQAEMKRMMRDHLDFTTAELVAHLQKDCHGRRRRLRQGPRTDSQDGRHVERRNHQAISEQGDVAREAALRGREESRP
jgi:hypothetical protein